jgi:hypothetical protein
VIYRKESLLIVEKGRNGKKITNLASKSVDSGVAMYKMACLAYCIRFQSSIATKFRFKRETPAEEMLKWVKRNLKEISRT